MHPEGMSSPREWVFDTPKNFRFNMMRKLQTSVKSNRKTENTFFPHNRR